MPIHQVITFAVSFLIAAEGTVFKGNFAKQSGKVSFANFISHEHHKLSTAAPIEVVKAVTDLVCALSCLKVPSCRSMNFGVAVDVKGTHPCELLSSDKYSAPDSFTSNQEFHHFSIPEASPCESSPCKNGATCVALYESGDYKCICTKDYHKGKDCEQRRSCKELLDAGYSQNGVYEINPRGIDGVLKVFCDQTVHSGGWTMIFKYIGGLDADINSENGLWKSSSTSAEDVPEVLTLTKDAAQHYKNRILPNWEAFQPSQARVSLYTGGVEVLSLLFNASDSDQENWFSLDRLTYSPWTDVQSMGMGYFALRANCAISICRSFLIHRPYNGCGNDDGWLIITDHYCPWEQRMAKRSIQHTTLRTSINWNIHENVGVADVLVVFVR